MQLCLALLRARWQKILPTVDLSKKMGTPLRALSRLRLHCALTVTTQCSCDTEQLSTKPRFLSGVILTIERLQPARLRPDGGDHVHQGQ